MNTSLQLLFLALGFFSINLNAQIDWMEPSTIASSEFGNNHPRIVLDQDELPLVIWGNSGQLMFSRWKNGSFTDPKAINPQGVDIAEASWMGPDIAAQGDTVYIVYKERPENSSERHVRCIRSTDGGVTFDNAIIVDSIGQDLSRFPSVTIDEDGHPIVAYMRFDPSFLNERWVVSRSMDYGASFEKDVLASGWSGPTSLVCNCCPGTICSSGSYVAMIYRDNNDDIRDNWVGISNTSSDTFQTGLNIDQQNWDYPICPSSGPDGFILGDSLYSVFMSGASGKNRVYFNAVHLEAKTTNAGKTVTDDDPGLNRQNFIRIDNNEESAAITWMQISDGEKIIPLLFSRDITKREFTTDTVATGNLVNVDVAVSSKKIIVVWQDQGSGTVGYRIGNIERPNSNVSVESSQWQVYPNPSIDGWIVSPSKQQSITSLLMYDQTGKLVYSKSVPYSGSNLAINVPSAHLKPGIYYLTIIGGQSQQAKILVKK